MAPSNPEFPQKFTPDVQVATAAYDEILEHNRNLTGFGLIFRGVLSSMMEDVDVVDITNPDTQSQRSIEEVHDGLGDKLEAGVIAGDMNAELLDIFHSDTFLRAGVKIAPLGRFGSSGDGKATTSTELVPMIENASLFSEFLGTLQPEDAKVEGTETFLCDVVANLSRVTSVCFDTDKQKDLSEAEVARLTEVGEDALRTFITIDPEYARLGIDGVAMRQRVEGISKELADFLGSGQGGIVPAEVTKEYTQDRNNRAKMRIYEGMTNRVHYWGRNLLPEYLKADSRQYLTPPKEQGFGPAEWQKDGGQYHWQEAFQFLHGLESDERTRSFADEVRQGLVVSLDTAIAELDDTNKVIYWRSQGADLANVRNALSGQQFDEAMLETYIKKPDYLS